MQVVVTKDQLETHRACDVYLRSVEWDSERQALVYPDWDATVTRLLSGGVSTTWLGWLVKHGLVPMTMSEFTEARRSR